MHETSDIKPRDNETPTTRTLNSGVPIWDVPNFEVQHLINQGDRIRIREANQKANRIVDPNQKWPDNLLIMRHGRSQRNHDRELALAAGKTSDFTRGVRDQDTPLTAHGEAQSHSAGVYLGSKFREPGLNGPTEARPIDVIYVSPYLRTRQTMEKLVEGLGYRPRVVMDERLREIDFGILDGLDRRSVASKFPEEARRREHEGKYFYRAPGGENRPDVKLRLRSFVDTLVRDCRGLNVVIVCHSVVVLSFRALLERWHEDDYLQVDKENDVKNASITHYAYEGPTGQKKLRLKEYNSIFYTEEFK